MPERSISSAGARFGYNGMEKDNELKGTGNSLDFGARIYDSRLGKSLSLDPFAAKFASESNYIFAGNNPIYYVDKNGEFKLHPNILRDYPAVHKYLSSQIEADVMNSTYILRAYKLFFNDLTDENIRSVFKNNGNETELFAVDYPEGTDAAGHYDVENKVVEINSEIFKYANDALENKKGNFSKDQQLEALTLLFDIILHEVAHDFAARYGMLDPLPPAAAKYKSEVGYGMDELIYNIKSKRFEEVKLPTKGEKIFPTRAESGSNKLTKGVIMDAIRRARSEDATKGTEWQKTLPTVPGKSKNK